MYVSLYVHVHMYKYSQRSKEVIASSGAKDKSYCESLVLGIGDLLGPLKKKKQASLQPPYSWFFVELRIDPRASGMLG